MLGSLSEFIDIRKKIKLATIINNEPSPPEPSPEQHRKNSAYFFYEPQDKSLYLRAEANKHQKKYKHASEMVKFAMELEEKVREAPRQHWIEKGAVEKNNLNARHQLLRAIVKTKQLEAQDNKNTLYDKAFGRIVSAYSKIKTQPIDTLLPPKMAQIDDKPKLETIEPPKKKHHSLDAGKLIQLQNSVKWAKKHGKKVQNFYTELGKSYELIEMERPGKSNYKLQEEMRHELEESRRRSDRRKKFNQLQQSAGKKK